jgi:hypothetical protein
MAISRTMMLQSMMRSLLQRLFPERRADGFFCAM